MSFRFPPFRPRAPWWSGDLQTLRNFLRPPRVDLEAFPERRLTLALGDGSGDRLSALLQLPHGSVGETPVRSLVAVVHGFTGSEQSAYMQASAHHLLSRRHPVLRINLRGAGPSRPLCRLRYHAGLTRDLHDALQALGRQEPDTLERGVFLLGYSLGGNMLLKYLAEYAGGFPARALGAASISAPIDLGAAMARALAPRNRIYHDHLLRSLKRECLAPGAELSTREEAAIRNAATLYDIDRDYVAPRYGYADAESYYAENMARRFLGAIRVPTLVIHALDDPWVPAEAYTDYTWSENPALVPLFPEGGGHVGFHGRGSRVPWHDRCVADFLVSCASLA